MAVYVDNALIAWKPPFNRYDRTWRMSHMFADTVEELHAFAQMLGLRREWFQCPPKATWEHYDVTKTVREKAIKAGAVQIQYRELPAKLRAMGRR